MFVCMSCLIFHESWCWKNNIIAMTQYALFYSNSLGLIYC
jgi:hypothetical protein